MESHPLKKYRAENHMTPAKLAEHLEVSRITVWRWESGNRKIDLGMLSFVSERTGIPKASLRPDLASLLQDEGEAA